MAQYVFTMNRVGKIVPPKRQIPRLWNAQGSDAKPNPGSLDNRAGRLQRNYTNPARAHTGDVFGFKMKGEHLFWVGLQIARILKHVRKRVFSHREDLVPFFRFGQDVVSGLAISHLCPKLPLCPFPHGKRSWWSTLVFWVIPSTQSPRYAHSPKLGRRWMS